MADLKSCLLVMRTSLQKWLLTPKFLSLILAGVVFIGFMVDGFPGFLREHGLSITPWVSPFLFNSLPGLMFFCFLLTFLFSNAPFMDQQVVFLIARVGKRNWIAGQLLFILAASMILSLFFFITPVFFLLRHLNMSWEWGQVMFSLAREPHLFPRSIGFSVSNHVLTSLTPVAASLYGLFLFFVVSVFIGFVILSFNLILRNTAGLVMIGFFIFMVPFSLVVGSVMFNIGFLLVHLSPLNWMQVSSIDWDSSLGLPNLLYVILILLISIIIMAMSSVYFFCRRDLELKGDG